MNPFTKCRVCGRQVRNVHGQFLCQTHWRMVPAALKGKLFKARERVRSSSSCKTALKAVEAEAVRAVRAAKPPKSKGGA